MCGQEFDAQKQLDILVSAVGKKYPGESRYDTALRFIWRAQEPEGVACMEEETGNTKLYCGRG
jgi:hypothetical protein